MKILCKKKHAMISYKKYKTEIPFVESYHNKSKLKKLRVTMARLRCM